MVNILQDRDWVFRQVIACSFFVFLDRCIQADDVLRIYESLLNLLYRLSHSTGNLFKCWFPAELLGERQFGPVDFL